MYPHPAYQASNAASLERLRDLVHGLSDADLARDVGEGWTVTTTLAHMGFYDARVLALFRRWEAGGEVADSPLDAGIINDAKQPYLQLLPGRATADLTLQLAEACDAAVAALTPEQLARHAAAGWPARLDRAHHRQDHLEQIERVLGR